MLWFQSKSPSPCAHTMSPSVSAMSNWRALPSCAQCSTSFCTQSDCADDGEASSRKYSDSSSAASIVDHNPGFADRLALSTNTRMARIWFHGFAKRSSAA